MKMSDALAAKFNDQITLELESSIAYLQMAAYFDARSLSGMAAWMRVQSEEERIHALRFFDFVLDRGNDVSIGQIPAPALDIDSALSAFEMALAQEERVTASIQGLYRAATEEVDAASFPLLQWFLEEQVEEESTVSEIVDRLGLVGEDGGALLELDRELGARPVGQEGE
jgi:ferritin